MSNLTDNQEIEIPNYFLCPISLQIMKDPVTTTTGITYDRENINLWLKQTVNSVCPVTKQQLLRDSDHLTPNHTLRRLIQAWCVINAKNGVERFPTPRAALTRTHVMKILRGLAVPHLQSATLEQLLTLATSDDHVNDRKLLVDCGVVKAMVCYIVECYKEEKETSLVEHALRIVTGLWTYMSMEVKVVVADNYEFLDSITWVLDNKFDVLTRNIAILLMKDVVKVASSSLAERLKPEFFKGVVKILRSRGVADGDLAGSIKAVLRVLLEVCPHGRNRNKIIEANTIFELIELELSLTLAQTERKKISDLVFCLLAQLCSCADGRAQFWAHSGGISVVSQRILRVSPVVDDRAVHIIAVISKYMVTNDVLQEIVNIGGVSKLCMVLQADCAKYLKDKVREILRMNSYVWNNSPCFYDAILTPNYSTNIKGQTLWF